MTQKQAIKTSSREKQVHKKQTSERKMLNINKPEKKKVGNKQVEDKQLA